MNNEELAILQSINPVSHKPMVNADDFEGYNGTLAYGYDSDKHTVHVYVKDGVIHYYVYNYEKRPIRHIHGYEIAAEVLRIEKRAYSERTYFEFAKLMSILGFGLTFTSGGEAAKELSETGGWALNGEVAQ